MYHAVADRSSFSIAGVMSRRRGPSDPDSATSHHSPFTAIEDPVRQGILSMDECESLFDQCVRQWLPKLIRSYFDQLQTCVCQLDPKCLSSLADS